MNTHAALTALDAHQTAVLRAVDHALELARAAPEEVRVDLAKARWDLVRRVRAYQLFKHGEIFDPGIFRGTPAQAETSRRMKAECVAAGITIEEYAVQWTGKDLVAEWPAYHAALSGIARAIRAHIACERRAIEALLAEAPRTRRAGGPGGGPFHTPASTA